MRRFALTLATFGTLLLSACGGGSPAAGGGDGDGGGDKSSFERLQAMPGELQAEVDRLMKPIDDLNAMADQLGELPTKLNINADEFRKMVQASIAGQAITLPEGVDEKGKAELDSFLKNAKNATDGLAALPENVKVLGVSVASKLPEIAVLATKVTAESKITEANPFSSAEEKAAAKQQAAEVAKIQGEIQVKVQEIQNKVTAIPQLGTTVLAKFTTALAGGGS